MVSLWLSTNPGWYHYLRVYRHGNQNFALCFLLVVYLEMYIETKHGNCWFCFICVQETLAAVEGKINSTKFILHMYIDSITLDGIPQLV